jgi:hypothetical protein
VTPQTFLDWRNQEIAKLKHRAAIRALEDQCGIATDEMGEYWLARTAALEKVAYEAEKIADVHHNQLLKALHDLNTIQPPTCREGDHASKGYEGHLKDVCDELEASPYGQAHYPKGKNASDRAA